ncbi:MAG: transcription-repair coupling factor [Chloroflexota bacterium]|nr:transcription-repair coupling factor [Chloroflexota bacterium]
MEHLDRVTPYVAPLDRPPSLSRLGTQEWKRTKARVERSTREMAAELLSLYASRELSEGHAFALDTPWQVQLEDAFPYEETPDQAEAILDMKRDMESGKPMDRLICGDVGYGKTEVALRAAFKAVTDGRQVAILVPTTVLAQQHFTTFSERLKPYPVRVEVLSRFRTDREQRDIVNDLAEGKVDIVIGTHRLVQKDVSFKNLGLIVVDEEQRFGVAHKERLKQMRSEVDVLTMTATPIPRTLHLSLSGIRDMSAIQTAPEERLPIKTYVSEFSDELIREAIRRELDRRGQVYFLHNRVYNIDYIAGYIRRLVPEARVGVAHGQMGENRLEQAMVDFAEGGVDVLVCTTIIESGLDIPNVNTLIVNRADTFGLAQLYQLRGRVGRSARRAYSYLLIPQHRSLTETAEKRLKTMLAATELGAGFQIAMKDLEIRGAGNILGANQSGHIYAVGFDLYTRLLSDAVESLRAQRASQSHSEGGGLLQNPEPRTENPPSSAQVDIGIPANIPTDYVSDLPTRLDVYRRLVSSATPADVDAMGDELVDRFGTLPWQVQNLLYVTKLKLAAAHANILSVNRDNGTVVLRLRDSVGGARQALRRHLGDHVDIGNTQVRVDISHASNGWERSLLETVQQLGQFTEQIAAHLAAVP